MRTAMILFLFSFLSSGSAWADIKDCLKIKEDFDRLVCYDRESGFNPVVETVHGKGDWIVQTKTSDMDDSTSVYLVLESFEHSNCSYDSAPHSIIIRCRENTTSLWVTFGGCFMSDNSGGGGVTYRIDSDNAQTKDFTESNSNKALGLWNGRTSIPFIKQLIGRSTLLLRAMPSSESTVTAKYNIQGLDEVIEPLRTACNW